MYIFTRGLILVFLGLFSTTYAQHPNVTVIQGKGACEPSVYINPTNLSNVVVGAVLNHVAQSSDRGQSWFSQEVKSTYGVWGDPVMVADTLGHFYYFHLSRVDTGSFIDRLVCQKSTDGGKTWSPGVAIGLNGKKAQDKQWAVVCPKTNHIYLTWTQFDGYKSTNPQDSSIIRFSKSTDGGISWSEPIRISHYAGTCLDDSNTVEGAVPAVDTQGNIFVTWAGPKGLVFNRSTDGGKTWLPKETPVDPMPGGWRQEIPGLMRCNGFPITAVDHSETSPYQNRIYVAWSDQRHGENDSDIFLKFSDNQGETWSNLIRVNNDKKGSHQFLPWLSVDPATGYIYLIFYDRRNYSDNRTDVYVAVSKNGGKRFENHRISAEPFTPNPQVFFGDYNNIHAINGFVVPVWTHLENKDIAVKIAQVDAYKIKTAHWLKPKSKADKLYKQTFTVFPDKPLSVWITDYKDEKTLAVLQNQKPTGKKKFTLQFYPKALGLKKGYYWINMQYNDGSDTLKYALVVDFRK
ncbi:MAG: sialidase family protein [Luteibaculaceae bacterium]